MAAWFPMLAALRLPSVTLLVSRLRGRNLFVLDLVGTAAVTYAALTLTYGHPVGPHLIPSFVTLAVVLGIGRAAANIRLGLYSSFWRSASIPDFGRMALAVGLGTLLSLLAVWRS